MSELYSPVAGEVVEVNGALDGDPAVVNRDPYGDGWMVTLRVADPNDARRAARGRRVPGAHRGVTSVSRSVRERLATIDHGWTMPREHGLGAFLCLPSSEPPFR